MLFFPIPLCFPTFLQAECKPNNYPLDAIKTLQNGAYPEDDDNHDHQHDKDEDDFELGEALSTSTVDTGLGTNGVRKPDDRCIDPVHWSVHCLPNYSTELQLALVCQLLLPNLVAWFIDLAWSCLRLTPSIDWLLFRLIYWFSVILVEVHTVDWLIDRSLDWLIRLISIPFDSFVVGAAMMKRAWIAPISYNTVPRTGVESWLPCVSPKVKPAKWHLLWWQRLCSVASFGPQRTFSNFSISAIKLLHTKKPRCQST